MPELKPFTDKQLASLEIAEHGKHKTGLIRKLARELRAEKRASAEATRQLLRYRSRVIELERRFKPVGRVLIVDTPPPRNEMAKVNGELHVFSDPGVDMCLLSVDVPYTANEFEDVLERELQGLGERFRVMPWELGPSSYSIWSRWQREPKLNNEVNF